MSHRFNLLPDRYVERVAERRRAGFTAGALLALLALLGVAYVSQGRALADATADRDSEQTQTLTLQARQARLLPYRRLAVGISQREQVLTAAMSTQVSWSELCGSLSVAFPPDSSLTSMTLESTLSPFGGAPGTPRDHDLVVGHATLQGYSVASFTPGVDRMLQLLATVTGLTRPRLQESAVSEIDQRRVTTFDGTGFVDGAVLTGRYTDGLPPEYDVHLPMLGGAAASGTAATGQQGAGG